MVAKHAASKRRRNREANIGVHTLRERHGNGDHNRKCPPTCPRTKRNETRGEENHGRNKSGANELLGDIGDILACA